MSQYLDQTILLIDKVFNSVSYSRRMNVLIGLGTEKVKAKNTLKKQASLLEEDSKELSGKSFRKQMIATAKAVYRKSRVNNSGKTLFRESPSLQKQNGGGRGGGGTICIIYNVEVQERSINIITTISRVSNTMEVKKNIW